MMQKTNSNPNDVFFDSSYKLAWKKIIPPGLTEAEADFIVEVNELKEGDQVLDLMCGYGRHAIELGKRGCQVTAVDNLLEYIEEINLQAGKDGLNVQAIQANVMDYNPGQTYKTVICMGNSFAFFDKKQANLILQKISSALLPGYKFIINTWTIAEIAIKYFKPRDWHYAGDYKCVLENQFKMFPSRIESDQTIVSPEGEVEVLQAVDYIYTLDELQELCEKAGLSIQEVYASPRKRKFTLGDTQAYIVIHKISQQG